MRVVAVLPLYPPTSLVGAWIATHAHLARAAAAGHEVDVVVEMSTDAPCAVDGVRVWPCTVNPAELVAAADVVVSHLGDRGHGQILASKFSKRSVRMVHGAVDDPHGRLLRHGAPNLVVCCSETARSWLAWPGPTVVAYPPINPVVFGLSGDPAGHAAAVNLAPSKGGDVVQIVSLANPAVRFVGVRGGYGRQVRPMAPNFVRVEPSPDPAVWLSGASVFLAPSQAETWGMAAVEALAAGVPVVAAPVDGLRESLGDAAVWVERDNHPGWTEALRGLRDPARWSEASTRSRARAHELVALDGPGRFVAALEGMP